MPRLFVGVPAPAGSLETQPILDALGEQRNVKPVDPALYHATLAFLGDVDEHRVPFAREAVQEGARGVARHEGRVVGLGAFPGPGRASVLWAGIEGTRLDALAAGIREALATRQLPRDTKDFHAHLTLARFRDKTNVTELVHRFEGKPLGPFPVHQAVLYESTLTPQGPEYKARERVHLEEGA